MKFSTFLIFTCIGAIGVAVFTGHSFPRFSMPTENAPTGSGLTTSSLASRPTDYVNPLDPGARRTRMLAPTQLGGTSDAGETKGGASDASAGPSFLSTAFSKLRLRVSSLFGDRKNWSLDDLRIARGQVAEIHDGKLYLNCVAWNVVQQGDARLHAGDAFSKSPVLGIDDAADELARYGTLKAMVNGSFASSPYNPRLWSPDRYLNGPAVLEGCPGRVGQYIKIVVAPVGMTEWQKRDIPVFTASFHLDNAQTAPGAWMWQGNGPGPLDKPAAAVR